MLTPNNIAREDAITAIRFPIRLLTVACLLTIMVFAWFGWIIVDARRDLKIFTNRLSRIEELRGVIVHLDEVLTMSARMAAATGDSQWEKRYRHFEPQLDAAIKATTKLETSPPDIKATTKTDEANIKLVEMENRAFALVRAGRKAEAQTVLFSPEYETQKQIYAEGIMSFANQSRREFDEAFREGQRLDLISLIGALVVLAISFAAGLSVVRGLQRWRAQLLDSFHQRAEAEENLRQAHAELEVRVKERTADLAKTNETLQAEISERNRAEEALHRSETKFRTLYDSTSDAVMLLDEKGFFDCNNATLAMFGCATREEFCSKHPADLSPPAQPDGTDSLTLANQRIATAMAKGCHRFEWMHQRAGTGETFPAEVLLNAMELDGKPVLQAVVRDITERKRSEESLRSQNAALEAAANAIVIADHNGTIQSVNPAFTALTGYTALEAVGQNPRVLKSGRQDKAFYRNLWQTISSGQVWSGELTNRRKDGSLYVEEMTITPLRNADGTIARYIAIKQDVSARKRAEDALRQSEEQFRAMFELASVGIAQADPRTGQWLRVNKKMCEITGYSVGELLQMRIADITYPEDRQSDREAFERVVRGEAPNYRIEKRYNRKDGALAWVNVNMTIIRDAAGQPARTVAAIEDITERKQAETALIRLAAIIASSDDAIISKDLNSIITSWNKGAEKLFGYSASEMVGTSIMRLLPADRQDEENQILGKITRGESAEHFETLRQDKDGRLIEVSITASPIKDATGKVIGVSKVARDITERKRTEASMQDMHQQLVEASRRAGMAEIATNVLHNVGNVLNSVNVSTGLIVESVKKSRVTSLARVVGLLREHAHDLGAFITHDPKGKHVPAHLAQLSEHLLADQEAIVSELDALRRNVEHIKEIVAMQQSYATFGGVKEMIDVVNLVEDSLRLNEGALSRHGVEIIREFEKVPLLNIEKHKILQILVNLLRNAKYACDESERADRRLTVRVANGEARVKISVMDNGVGIPPENLTRIFNHGFTTRKGGHGFGLHSGALAAKEMGGSLTVHSDGPGQGAVFTLELPCPARGSSHE